MGRQDADPGNRRGSKRSRRKKAPSGRAERAPVQTIARIDKPETGLERMPSNAPTMAIAPSDYEHIYHEGPIVQQNNAGRDHPLNMGANHHTPSPNISTPPRSPPPIQTQIMIPVPVQPPLGPSTPPHIGGPMSPVYVQPGSQQAEGNTEIHVLGRNRYAQEIQVTPDGYTLLGHTPDPVRRIALPPYVVRSNNQFSRAAIARVARFLASRAEPYNR